MNLPVKIVLGKCAGKKEMDRGEAWCGHHTCVCTCNSSAHLCAAECRCSVTVIREFSLSTVFPEYTTFIYGVGGNSLGVKAVVLRVGSFERKDKTWSNVISSERMNRVLPACKSRGSNSRESQLSAMALFVQWQSTIKIKLRNTGRNIQRGKKLS